jgi:uncharacterized protein YdaU (DUF1376 family)
MTAKIWRIDFYADEWLAGTVGLTMEEEGLYVRACALIYSRGGPVTVDLLKRACRGEHGNRVNACLGRLVKLGKLDVSIDGVMSKRCGNELEKARKRSEKQRENGRKGGRANGLAKAPGSAVEKPLSTYQEEKEEANASPPLPSAAPPSLRSVGSAAASAAPEPPDLVKELWDRGVKLLGPQQSARNVIGRMRQDFGDPAVMDAIIACEANCISDPIPYLRACLLRSKENGNGRNHRVSARENLWLGFAQAADCDPDRPPAPALLDRQ